jgi:hypothetical protein
LACLFRLISSSRAGICAASRKLAQVLLKQLRGELKLTDQTVNRGAFTERQRNELDLIKTWEQLHETYFFEPDGGWQPDVCRPGHGG